MILALLTVKN